MSDTPDILTCTDLAIGHGKTVIMDRLNLSLAPGKILAIVGPSGCGKSTLMRALGGLDEPLGGKTTLMGVDLAAADGQQRQDILRQSGFLFQGAALFSSLTLRENIEMPMREFLKAPRKDIRQLAEYKLALVGLADAMDKLPSEISGGMAKRAGIARAMALDPAVTGVPFKLTWAPKKLLPLTVTRVPAAPLEGEKVPIIGTPHAMEKKVVL